VTLVALVLSAAESAKAANPIRITPHAHSAVRNHVAIRVRVSPTIEAKAVTAFVDGRRIGIDRRRPFAWAGRRAWNTRKVKNGLHRLRFVIRRKGRPSIVRTSLVRVANLNGRARPPVVAAPIAPPSLGVPPDGLARACPAIGLHMDLTWNGDPQQRRQAIRGASVVGAAVSRNSLLWHLIEPVQGQRDWARVDAVVSELEAAGIEPLLVLYGSPTWASGADPSSPDAYLEVPGEPAAFNRWLERYEDFVSEAAARYRGRVQKWEVWNEPNEHYTWKPAPDMDQFARFYAGIRDSILRENPSADVALGGLAGITAGGLTDVNGLDFLRGMLARGVPLDAVAIHPYAGRQQAPDVTIRYDNSFTDVAKVHDLLESAGLEIPIWITEWGWKSDVVGQQMQAQYVARSLDMIVNDYPFVTLATYFIDHDRQVRYTQGLFDVSGRPKPAASEFALRATASSQRCRP
jgi:hypothetical protein